MAYLGEFWANSPQNSNIVFEVIGGGGNLMHEWLVMGGGIFGGKIVQD